MTASPLTEAQQALLRAMRELRAAGAYEDEFQAIFPPYLAPSILFFKRHAGGGRYRPLCGFLLSDDVAGTEDADGKRRSTARHHHRSQHAVRDGSAL